MRAARALHAVSHCGVIGRGEAFDNSLKRSVAAAHLLIF